MNTQVNHQQESYMTDVFTHPGMYSSGNVITAVAMGRWLNVSCRFSRSAVMSSLFHFVAVFSDELSYGS